jgi:hypothetical protein
MTTIRKRTRKIKNNTLAIEAAPAAISVKPKTAAIIAITKKMAAHLSIKKDLRINNYNTISCQDC